MSSVRVKVLHLNKKLTVNVFETDFIYNLIENIQYFLKKKEYNFGIFIKNKKGKDGNFINENVRLIDIINKETKVIYKKKERVFNFDAMDKNSLKIINNMNNKELFVQWILKNDITNVMNLLHKGFDPNYLLNDEPPIHYAVVPHNSVALITLLTSQGAHIDYRSLNYQTILHKAVRLSKPETVKIILELGMNVNSVDNNGLTPLYLSVLCNNDITCFVQLLKYTADITCTDYSGISLLHQACLQNKLRHVEVLVQQGENINTRSNYNGNSGLHFAVLGKSSTCISYLLENGANIDIKNNSNLSAFEMAKDTFPEAISLFKMKMECEIFDLNDSKLGLKVIHSYEKENSNSLTLRLSTDTVLSMSPGPIEEIYFGLKTTYVKFIKTLSGGFGFCLESGIIDFKDVMFFIPSYEVPSIHRICKWKVRSIMKEFPSKPFVLEVNEVYVGNMHHKELAKLINSIENKVILKITNNSNQQTYNDNEILSMSSTINSAVRLDDISVTEQDMTTNVFKNFEKLPKKKSEIIEQKYKCYPFHAIYPNIFYNETKTLIQSINPLSIQTITQSNVIEYPEFENIICKKDVIKDEHSSELYDAKHMTQISELSHQTSYSLSKSNKSQCGFHRITMVVHLNKADNQK